MFFRSLYRCILSLYINIWALYFVCVEIRLVQIGWVGISASVRSESQGGGRVEVVGWC